MISLSAKKRFAFAAIYAAILLAVPLVAACLFVQVIYEGGIWLRWVALGIFVAAAITDYFDGYLARAWSQHSAIGRMLDPIADKLLVGIVLATAVGPLLSGLFNNLSNRLFDDARFEVAGFSFFVPGVRITLWLAGIIILVASFLAIRSMRAGDEPPGPVEPERRADVGVGA